MSNEIRRATGLLVIEAVNSNPNGDPDRESDPRQRPDGRGEISPDRDNDEDVEFSLDTRNFANRLAPLMPKADKKTGRILLSSDMITKLRRQRCDDEIKVESQCDHHIAALFYFYKRKELSMFKAKIENGKEGFAPAFSQK